MPSTSDLNGTTTADNSSDTTAGASAMPQSSVGQTLRRMLIVVLFVGVAAMLLLRSRGTALDTSVKPLPVVAHVPEFSLTERSGKTVTNADLLGTVWVADFVFTTCAGPCPELSLRMRSLQKDIVKYGGTVKVVSFSIDPTYDQPPVLRAYAERYQADPDLWWFLTCKDEKMMHQLVKEGFLQAVTPAGGGAPIIHSTQFVLIDQQGRIRSWHDGLEAASKPLILRDIERLLSVPTG